MPSASDRFTKSMAKELAARGVTANAVAPGFIDTEMTAAMPEPAPSNPVPQPTPPRLFSGYALQAGVFSDPRRAEALHARLVNEGIPTTIVARVQVGPFKTQAEADAARARMKALGIDSVMLMPKGGKRH